MPASVRPKRAGSEGQSAYAALQCGEPLFQHVLRRVGEASVDVARVGKSEARCRMGGVVEHIGSRLVNGYGAGIGRGIGLLLADMELQRFKFIVGHHVYLFSWNDFDSAFLYPVKTQRSGFDRERRNKVIGRWRRLWAAP